MEKKRTGLTAGFILAAIGIIILGTDRIIASANTDVPYAKTLTLYTLAGVLIIATAVLVVLRTKNR